MSAPRTTIRAQLSSTHRRAVAGSIVAATAMGVFLTGLSGTAIAAPAADPTSDPARAKNIAEEVVDDTAQFQCFSNIVEHESGWDHTATNPSSGAYGLVQALPATKMASAGGDWKTSPETQIRWGLDYMNERYGNPCAAWEFWQANQWY